MILQYDGLTWMICNSGGRHSSVRYEDPSRPEPTLPDLGVEVCTVVVRRALVNADSFPSTITQKSGFPPLSTYNSDIYMQVKRRNLSASAFEQAPVPCMRLVTPSYRPVQLLTETTHRSSLIIALCEHC